MPIHQPLILKAPGNGDCLYHSVMLNIIHGSLTGKIKDASKTGIRIKTQLLPAIARQLKAHGLTIDFSGKTLKASILALLQAAPLDNLKEADELNLLRSVKSNKNDIDTAILKCDFYHLLRDICGPAMREVMQDGANTYHKEFAEQVKNIIFMEFRNYFIKNNGKTFGLNNDYITAATNYLASSEFYGIPKNISASIHKEWNKIISTFPKQKNQDHENYIISLFNRWWGNDQVELYKNMHKLPGIMAGVPHIHILGLQLQCQLKYVDSTNGSETLQSPPIDNADTFHYQGGSLHYDAVIETDNTGNLLKTRLNVFNDKQEGLKDTKYTWAAEEVSQEIIPVGPVKDTLESIKETLTSINHYETGKIVPAKNPNTVSMDIINAAKLGYKGALKATTFGKNLESIAQISMDKLSDEDKAEAQDLLFLIEEQNKEISRFLKG